MILSGLICFHCLDALNCLLLCRFYSQQGHGYLALYCVLLMASNTEWVLSKYSLKEQVDRFFICLFVCFILFCFFVQESQEDFSVEPCLCCMLNTEGLDNEDRNARPSREQRD